MESEKPMEIEPLERVSSDPEEALYGQVIARLRTWIQEGRFKEGDFLPSERELATMFGVSRVPIREALKILEFTGIAEQIRGRGVRLRKITANRLISNIDFALIASDHTLKDLFEAREAIEIKAATLAAERWTQEDLRAMEAAVDEVDEVQRSGGDLLDTSMSFHTALIAAAHNLAISEVNLYLSDWLRVARQQVFRTTPIHDSGLHDHRAILERVKARDSEGAAARMKEHLDKTWEVLAQGLGPEPEAVDAAPDAGPTHEE